MKQTRSSSLDFSVCVMLSYKKKHIHTVEPTFAWLPSFVTEHDVFNNP